MTQPSSFRNPTRKPAPSPPGAGTRRASPSLLDRYHDCPAQVWLQQHPDGAVLPLDAVPSQTGRALHAVLMELQLRCQPGGPAGSAPDIRPGGGAAALPGGAPAPPAPAGRALAGRPGAAAARPARPGTGRPPLLRPATPLGPPDRESEDGE